MKPGTMNKKQEAWVVFTDNTDIAWLRFLKRGFRHCFVIINDGEVWMSIDPLSSYTDIAIYHHIDCDFDLPEWLDNQGYLVCKARVNKKYKKTAPTAFISCVESVKRVLGIHRRFIVTPWQLFCFLRKQNSEKNNHNNSIVLNKNKRKKLKGDLSWVA